jgi:hypothetical protein
MATVVNLPRNDNALYIGQAIASVIQGKRDQKNDALQSELIREMNEAPDEVSMAAIMADPRFERVVNSERFPDILSMYQQLKPGSQLLTGYDADGNQQAITYDPRREKAEELLATNGLTLSPMQSFSYIDGTDPEAAPRIIPGIFKSRQDALNTLSEEERSTAQILTEAQARISLEASRERRISRQSEDSLNIEKALAQHTLESPLTRFDALVAAYNRGDLSETQFKEAWAKETAVYGRTQFDIQAKSLPDLVDQAAATKIMAEEGSALIAMVMDDPGILTRVGGVARLVDEVGSEFKEIGRVAGIVPQSLDSYENVFENIGLAERSREFKAMIIDFAIVVAASRGMRGRDLSNQDFERIMSVVGGDYGDPESFIVNMSSLIDRSINRFNTRWTMFQGSIYEDENGAFMRPGVSRDTKIEAKISAIENEFGITLQRLNDANTGEE